MEYKANYYKKLQREHKLHIDFINELADRYIALYSSHKKLKEEPVYCFTNR
jgi:4-hydroxyphenylpyruvate dioxygenase-like putative hemolysin